MAAGRERDLRFVLGPVDLTLELELARTGGVNAGANVWMISLGGKRERSDTVTHTIRLALTPVSSDGGRTLVVDPTVTGRPR
jgi:hypothetical protein